MKQRKIFKELLEQKSNRKISLLLGARQVGKTTLLNALREELCTKNNGVFIDLDIFSNVEKVSTFEMLINTMKLHGYDGKGPFYLFLDEFQHYNEMSIIMKNVYDHCTNVKIYASGSSSITIKHQVQESLAGRKKINIIYPLDFEEFLWFKEESSALHELANSKRLTGEQLALVGSSLHQLLHEFLVFGGYPEVALQGSRNAKIDVLESIFDLYVKKDLVEYLNVEKILQVKKLIAYLAINNGNKIKYDAAAHACSLSYLQVREYIEVLKETHIITMVSPFFTNKNKELVKIPKIYFIDNGVRNFFINNFNPIQARSDAGFLFEGYIIAELLKSGIETVTFWQDKNKHEVDIIIDTVREQIPIEAKFKDKLKREDFIGLAAFLREYNAKKAYLVNMGIQKEIKGVNALLPYHLSTLKK